MKCTRHFCLALVMATCFLFSSACGQPNLEQYLQENKISYQTSPDGFYYTIEKQGDTSALKGSVFAKVHYRGTLLDGTQFDSSYDREFPIAFKLGTGRVIKGWDLGIPLIGTGGKGVLYLPANLAYGSRARPTIPANSPLIFEVEVLDTLDQTGYQNWQKEMGEVMRKLQEKEAKERLAKQDSVIQKYLADNDITAQKDEQTGLYYSITEEGDKTRPVKEGQKVSVHYAGRLLDGKAFDNSYDRGQPFTFAVGRGQVIRGWDLGLQKYNVGGKGTIFIPSDLGYGPRGAGATIPPNTILVFDIEIVDAQ